MKKVLFFVFVLALVSCTSNKQKSDSEPYVLMISFDGFRYDYVERYNAPNFKHFIAKGVASESILSTFPSKTFPNHYSLITGLHASNHGLVDNVFYDSDLKIKYSTSNRDLVYDPRFYGGLPLWQLVQKDGMKSASFFWPGSETKIAGSYPDYWKKYDSSVSNEQRIDTVMRWLQLPKEKRPRYISLYFGFTDGAGHKYGPVSEGMGNAVLESDRLLGIIMDDLKHIDLDINVIVVSDHGMMEIKPKAENFLTEEALKEGINLDKTIITVSGTHVRSYCKDKSYKDELYQLLKAKEKHFTVYKREEMPKEWHSRNNIRVGDIFLEMEAGYYVVSQTHKDEILKANTPIGVHGYDPKIKDVQGIFFASGPQIAKGKKIPSFNNVDIYPFVAELLGITSYPRIDGNKEILCPFIIR